MGEPQKYRKKPIVVEAVQWRGDNLEEVIAFTGLHESAKARWPVWTDYEAYVAAHGLKIFTLEGPLMASIGDWIIKGVKGEFYPCKPDIFEATYELADVPAPRVTEEALNAIETLFQWSRAYADCGDTWDAQKQGDPNTVALHEMIIKTAAVEQSLGWKDGIRPTAALEDSPDA